MGSTRRSFTEEYRASAVSFVLDDGRTIKDVATGIGVHEMTLGKWVKKARDERGGDEKDRPLSTSEREELERLRAENRELKMQAEFAKKVAAWFAKDQR
jgi:transposase